MEKKRISGWKDKVLFTPGPLTTSKTVKQSMLCDLGSRDTEFIQAIEQVRQKTLDIGKVSDKTYTAIPLQGSGTYAVEAVVSTATPPDGKWLVIVNGVYGERINKIINILNLNKTILAYNESSLPDLKEIEKTLAEENDITHVAIIHCETTTGLINPIEEVGKIVKKYNKIYFVDAMSSFGAVPIDFETSCIDYLASTANKNIEGVPGVSFVIAKKDILNATKGNARSLVLDLREQWLGLDKDGQFRFTPPTHVILAFNQALDELVMEGGVEGRAERYRENQKLLVTGMREMGFQEYLDEEIQGYIITSFIYPKHPNFLFEKFYNILNEKSYVIYPGKVSDKDCFRIGSCGRLFKSDMKDLLAAIKETIDEMGVEL